MPLYDFCDTKTGEQIELQLKISERDEFLKANPHMQQILGAASQTASKKFYGTLTARLRDLTSRKILDTSKTMKCAVLCNGPSRTAYSPSSEYSLVLGCNIPWTDVDGTIIIDHQVVKRIVLKPQLITCKDLYLSGRALQAMKVLKNSRQRHRVERYLGMVRETFPVELNWHSSGHCAAEVAIRKGFTLIDVYGCDSYFTVDTTSYTRKFIARGPRKGDHKRVNEWRDRWDKMEKKHKEVTFNFIRGTDANSISEDLSPS